MARDRCLKRRSRRVFVAALGFFLLTHGGHFYSVDNFTVYSTARSLVTEGSLAIQPNNNVTNIANAPGRNGRTYGIYSLGLPLLEAPFIWMGLQVDKAFPASFATIVGPNVSIFYPENFSTFGATLLGPLLAALATAEFWIIAELLGYPRGVVAWLTVILVASTQFWPATPGRFSPHRGGLLSVAGRSSRDDLARCQVWTGAALYRMRCGHDSADPII